MRTGSAALGGEGLIPNRRTEARKNCWLRPPLVSRPLRACRSVWRTRVHRDAPGRHPGRTEPPIQLPPEMQVGEGR
jgi:hypothetical protein